MTSLANASRDPRQRAVVSKPKPTASVRKRIDVGRIRRLNDFFRGMLLTEPDVRVSAGVRSLAKEYQHRVFLRVRTHSEFSSERRKCEQHDFGRFEEGGHEIIWRITYHDLFLRSYSAEPDNPHTTRRVLTIMLAEEY